MIQKVVDSICRLLKQNIEEADIYTETVKQSLKKPCFVVICDQMSCQRFLGNRFFYSIPVCIDYFADSVSTKEKEYAQYELMADWLEVLPIDDGYIRGSHIHTTTENGRMHFWITYEYYGVKTEEKDMMGSLDWTRDVQ